MMPQTSRLIRRFALRAAERRTALIFYLVAGDPSVSLSPRLLHALVEGGADAIELGYPFADAILDGPVIRRANRRALDAGSSVDATLDIVRRFREGDQDTPLILMGYANPVLSRGADGFAAIAEAGADGLILPDLPPREAVAYLPGLREAGLVQIPLLPAGAVADAPLLRTAGFGGFLYVIPQAGPTGGAAAGSEDVRQAVERGRTLSDLPMGVGFGIKTPDIAREFAAHADAVIVGSALVDFIDARASASTPQQLAADVRAFCESFRRAIDGA
ncbi:tryptophan synthase subunit alpha [Rhizorhabdus phycosphaerae]|uniref:tryptophan synthase subunit alpha n=1 Tax=Rhizorhabdus phycosphaerae TaxID=2711156 RepID=UPI0013EBCC3E|nr:tryptophan synthase subunit alpha [Rhizorhabdus phycosphaerae]